MKIAIIGAGISGLGAAWLLNRAGHDITLYEANDYLGGHSRTIEVNTPVRIDLNSGQGDNLSTSIVPAFTVRLDGTVAAVGVGYSAAVAVTFDFTGAFRVGFRTDPVFTGMLRLQRGDLIITQRMGRGSRRVGDPINIFPEARLWQGQAPS